LDIEKMLAQFKETADKTILPQLNDTTALEKRIRSRVGKVRSRSAGKLVAAVSGLAAVISLFLLYQPSIQPDNQQSYTNARVDQLPSDQQIRETVASLKGKLKLGMTQVQVKEQIGSDYSVVDDNGDLENGADEYWSFSYFKKQGYVPKDPEYVVDQAGLRSRKVGVKLFLAWKEKRLYLYTISYVQGEQNDVIFYMMNPDGSDREENLTNPSPENELVRGSFTLTLPDRLIQRYDQFAAEKKDEWLEGLDPLDIFKMYFHAEQNKDYETQYALYFQDPETEIPTLQQFLQDVKSNRTLADNERKFIEELKKYAKSYEIKNQNGNEAVIWITFSNDRDPLGFRMKKNKQGIWKVSWMPIQ
jgi:hypothetical protein